MTAFQDSKETLAAASLLVHPQPDAPTCILAGASDTAVEAVLQQRINSKWCPLAFFSRKLNSTQQKYSTFDRELLAIYLSIQHFATLSRVVIFKLPLTTSPSRMLSEAGPPYTHPDKPGSWITSPSLHQMSIICQALPMVQLTHYPAWIWLPSR